MIYPSNAQYTCEEIRKDQLLDAQRERELREAGVDSRGWVSFQACRMLCSLGHRLVILGQWMERRFGAPIETPLGENPQLVH